MILSIRITFSWTTFVLMADDRSKDCRVCIIEAQLCVRHVKLSDEKYRNIQQSFPVTPASYPIKRVFMKTNFIAQGISSLYWENAHMGQLPECLRLWWIMMHTQEVLQRLILTSTILMSSILMYLKWLSIWMGKCLSHHSCSILLIINT